MSLRLTSSHFACAVFLSISTDVFAACPGGGNCNGHGACIAGSTCVCFTGYAGADCGQCAANYYNYPTCTFCEVNTTCSGHGTCSATGACVCNVGFTGPNCSMCAEGYYGPNCLPCPGGGGASQCSGNGSCSDGLGGTGACACNAGWVGTACQYSSATTCNGHGTVNLDGSCSCFTGYAGANCQLCAANYYSYPTCTFCQAGTTCNSHGTCSVTGACVCSTGYTGANCQFCATNYYNYPTCTYCLASTTCSGNGTCSATGSCVCNTGFAGANCNQCATNYYNYPTCTFCSAATTCSGNGACTGTGSCVCNAGWTGPNCATPAVPSVTQWRSVRTHAGAGDLAIVLNATAAGNGLAGPSVETRQGGIQKILVDFNRAVTLVDPSGLSVVGRTTTSGVMGGPLSYLPAAVNMLDADTMQILFNPGFLPDQTCYTITIGATTFAEGITGDSNVSVRSLVGDVTGSGDVNLSDAILAAVRAAASVTAASSPATDINLSGGTITVADALAAKAQVISPTRKALCP